MNLAWLGLQTRTVPSKPQTYAALLWALLGLFCLRVIAQIIAQFFEVSLLPAAEEWQSGLIPYPWLLFSQLLIILVLGKVCLDFTAGGGFFATPRRAMASALLTIGSVYLAIMVVRYVLRMTLYPHERWTGGSIPIFFHWVLAIFILLVGAFHWFETQRHVTRSPPRPFWVRWGSRAGWSVVVLAVSAGIFVWLGYQLGPSILAHHLGTRAPEFAVRIERGISLTASDGVSLVADIYHPQRAGPVPTILVRLPYDKALVNTLSATIVGRMWAERGYTVVIQGTRGRYESGGQHHPLRGERQDGIDTLRWIAQQPWYDGRLGMWGTSYFGYTQWVLADRVAPGPSALGIQLASTDFYAMFYPGGAFSLETALFWAVRSRGDSDVIPEPEVLQRGYDGFPLSDADTRAVGAIPFFNDLVSHPEKDQYWIEVDGEDRTRMLKAPVLLMAGWYDPFLPAQIADFMRIRREAPPKIGMASRLIVGPWSHWGTVSFPGGLTPGNWRVDSLGPSVPWFDQHLRAADARVGQAAPVRIYVMGEHTWRDEQEWPLARTRYTAYYLRSGGRANGVAGDGLLAFTAPEAPEPPDSYVYDPVNPVPTMGGAMLGPRSGTARQNEVEARPDVLVYTTPPLAEDLEVTGPVRLVLFVSTTVSHTDFTAKLVDVHPDGSAYNVSEGILRRGYGGPTGTGADRPTEIEIDLWPTGMVFLKGHRIRLEVSSSNYPRFDRNPNTGRPLATETSPIAATQAIFHRGDSPSRLILPVIPR